jgi:hypothetical protein
MPNASPDLTAKRKPGDFKCTAGQVLLEVNVCNRGTQPVGDGMPVTFYEGQPSAMPICTANTKGQLDPGKCALVSCAWKGAPSNKPVDVWAVVDDKGAGTGTTSECEEKNNRTMIPQVRCVALE